ncbi:ferritin-like domain-containing protein [Sphingomonas rubra]|uniref:Ferritin-like domain-containing protein n=1 Tax=Sphingomonas rubra TaxID=634430 RepID=A0A1I5TXR2_9SPHN|nr:ferritin-like domain-containing protein [Sphingomonas rubra]SFP87407.1 Ferritin-like domain-containing protein [Sphingomonas rubra]
MTDSGQLIEAMDHRVQRREARREFFKSAFGVGALAVGGVAALNFSSRAGAQTALTDVDILNFALNLEYLEAQFYSYAANGVGLAANLQTGVTTTGAQGAVQIGSGATQARRVPFTDRAVAAYAREIAADEIAHVSFLRSASALGNAAVAQPAINIAGGAGSAFAAAATAASIPGGSTFDPYANDDNFLLGAYIFEDVGVTAYKGASPLITNKIFLEAAAGILAVEAYHAATVRTTLYARGVAAPDLRTFADGISNARDTLDGSMDLDQGISPLTRTGATAAESNIVPLDPNGLAYSRSPGQVLNIVYLTRAAATMGGFFPSGVNGNAALRASTAN